MMVGFFDIAVPRTTDKWQYFIRQGNAGTPLLKELQDISIEYVVAWL